MDVIDKIDFVEVPTLVKKLQVRRHRKKRINKKWLKRYGVVTIPDENYYLSIGSSGRYVLCAHPKTMARVRAYIDAEKITAGG